VAFPFAYPHYAPSRKGLPVISVLLARKCIHCSYGVGCWYSTDDQAGTVLYVEIVILCRCYFIRICDKDEVASDLMSMSYHIFPFV
jgi:hypothetical protein